MYVCACVCVWFNPCVWRLITRYVLITCKNIRMVYMLRHSCVCVCVFVLFQTISIGGRDDSWVWKGSIVFNYELGRFYGVPSGENLRWELCGPQVQNKEGDKLLNLNGETWRSFCRFRTILQFKSVRFRAFPLAILTVYDCCHLLSSLASFSFSYKFPSFSPQIISPHLSFDVTAKKKSKRKSL